MNNLFEITSSYWVRYTEYEYKEAGGILYIAPIPGSKVKLYDTMNDAEEMIIKALNVGMLCMKREGEKVIQRAVMDFVRSYGLLGFMTALPTTPEFMDYDSVYLPTNHFIREEAMPVTEYTELFFPFNRPTFFKDISQKRWDVKDREMIALAMTMNDKPLAYNMCLHRDYAERYDWLALQFKDLAFTFLGSYMYYQDYCDSDDETREMLRLGMAAFGGIAPTYRIVLREKPTIVWDFHSLLLGMQMMFSFMLTDEQRPLQSCRNCGKVFITVSEDGAGIMFCGARCKRKFENHIDADL